MEVLPINPIVGDDSWILSHGGVPPGPTTGDRERVACHLQFALDRMRRASSTSSAPPSAAHARRELALEALQTYIDEGIFPRHDAPAQGGKGRRAPLFIDSRGTHCAVGCLMLATGDGALAQAVNQEWSTFYVQQFDMETPLGGAVREWARSAAFTTEELAILQPDYGLGPRGGQMMIKTLTGKTIVIVNHATDTIAQVKQRIQEKEGIPPDMQRLIAGGKELEDGRTVSDYPSNSGMVHLVLKLK